MARSYQYGSNKLQIGIGRHQPLGPLRIEIDLHPCLRALTFHIQHYPFTGYGDTQLYDFRAKVDYTFDFVPVIQPAIELGYRTQKFKIDEDGEDTKIDFEFSGIYGGVMLRF